MKTILILLGNLMALQVLAQSSSCPEYPKYLSKGDSIMQKGEKVNFEAAINAYNIAMVHCPAKAQEARQRIQAVFNQIELLGKKAVNTLEALKEEQKKTKDLLAKTQMAEEATKNALEDLKKEQERTKEQLTKTQMAEDETKNALDELKKEQERTKELLTQTQKAEAAANDALQKAQKLINAIYFYADRFALTFYENRFFFINKNGDEVKKLGSWDKAEQFGQWGFAEVEKGDVHYFLDTLGNFLKVVNSVKNLDPKIKALDLSTQRVNLIPAVVYAHSPLKILLLKNGRFKRLDKKIENLDQLQALDLSHSKIRSLPPQIVNLLQLKNLDLRGTKISKLPLEFGKLEHLQVLKLGPMEINSLPDSFFQLKELKYCEFYQQSFFNLQKIQEKMPWCKFSFGDTFFNRLHKVRTISSLSNDMR